jgi:two-component system, chemotaxis family, protein-glutamate methylesterase/glutaminase
MTTTQVMVIDDSTFVRKALVRVLSSIGGVAVVGQAASGAEAIAAIGTLRPDVVTLDLEMPGLGGLDTLRELLRVHPRAQVIMLSAHTQAGAGPTLDALALGAVDFIDKRRINVVDFGRLKLELEAKLEVARAARRSRGRREEGASRLVPPRPSRPGVALDLAGHDAMIIGASTGGPPAVQRLLATLPADFPLPVVVVQHMPSGFTRPFADRLAGVCRVAVREARHGEPLTAGVALIAPAGWHLELAADRTIALDPASRGESHVPSIDVAMRSLVDRLGGRVIGVLLTGMGRDGADGLTAIRRAGGLTLAESEESCVVYGMPRAALAQGGVEHMLALDQLQLVLEGAIAARRGRP